MIILAFLQNSWFRDPERAEQKYAGASPTRRAVLNARYLFYKSRTGAVLRQLLGDELCNRIIWEEASPRKAVKSSGAFPADLDHIRCTIEHFKPDRIICFGAIAKVGVVDVYAAHRASWNFPAKMLFAKHPTARANVRPSIAAVREELEVLA